jgi:hypothetical protein
MKKDPARGNGRVGAKSRRLKSAAERNHPLDKDRAESRQILSAAVLMGCWMRVERPIPISMLARTRQSSDDRELSQPKDHERTESSHGYSRRTIKTLVVFRGHPSSVGFFFRLRRVVVFFCLFIFLSTFRQLPNCDHKEKRRTEK